MHDLTPAKVSTEAQAVRTGRPLILLLVGLAIGVAADRILGTLGGTQDSLRSATQAMARPQPPVSRIGDRLVVPPDSLLRSQLVVADVMAKDVARSLLLPAMVESDPARTIKVLPPVTGRVAELKVQLGERVTE